MSSCWLRIGVDPRLRFSNDGRTTIGNSVIHGDIQLRMTGLFSPIQRVMPFCTL